jgi:uncharacterized membrane protein YraQ (UPF0718 family)
MFLHALHQGKGVDVLMPMHVRLNFQWNDWERNTIVFPIILIVSVIQTCTNENKLLLSARLQNRFSSLFAGISKQKVSPFI